MVNDFAKRFPREERPKEDAIREAFNEVDDDGNVVEWAAKGDL